MADHADASYSLVLRGLLSEREFNRAHDAIVEGILHTPVATIPFAAGMALGGWKAPKRCACLESPRSLPRGSSRTEEITMNMTQPRKRRNRIAVLVTDPAMVVAAARRGDRPKLTRPPRG